MSRNIKTVQIGELSDDDASTIELVRNFMQLIQGQATVSQIAGAIGRSGAGVLRALYILERLNHVEIDATETTYYAEWIGPRGT